MLARLYVVLKSIDPVGEKEVQAYLKSVCPAISMSPGRENRMIKATEFYCTADLTKEEVLELLPKLNDGWMGEYDGCEAYYFNSHMCHEAIDTLIFDFFED